MRPAISRRVVGTTSALVAAALCCWALGAAGGAGAAQSSAATTLLHTALADAAARGSVHQADLYVSGSHRITFSDDIATAEGRQVITHYGGEQAEVLVVGGVAYFSGNQAALTSYFGMPAAVARKVGSRWVSVPATNSGYSQVAAGVTLPSELASLTPPGTLSETAPTTVDGQAVIGIRGTLPASAGKTASEILYVSRAGKPLPVVLSESRRVASGSLVAFTSSVTFSSWGEKVAIKAPTNTVPASSLLKSG